MYKNLLEGFDRAYGIKEDTIKTKDGKWANVGKDGKVDSGKFKTKKQADAQRKAMFAKEFKESLSAENIRDKMYEVVIEGIISAEDLAINLMHWLPSDELFEFVKNYGYDELFENDEYSELDMKKLTETISLLSEAEISDEDKHDNELLKNIYNKIQNRLNAKLTDEEKAVLDKYNLYLDKDYSGQNSIFIRNPADPNKKFRRNYPDLFRYPKKPVNLADRARKFPDRSKEAITYEDEEREKIAKMRTALADRSYSRDVLNKAEDDYNKDVDKLRKQYDIKTSYYKDVANSADKTINKLLRKDESLNQNLAKYQKWVDYDMKRYGRISDNTKSYLKKAGLEIVKDQYGSYEVIANTKSVDEAADLSQINGTSTKALQDNIKKINSATTPGEVYDKTVEVLEISGINTNSPSISKMLNRLQRARTLESAFSIVYNSLLKGSNLGVR